MAMFRIGNLAWENPNDSYEDHIRYLENDVIKPMAMSVRDMVLRFNEILLLKEFIQPPSKREDSALDADWERHGEKLSFDQQRRMQFNALPETFKSTFKDLEEYWKPLSVIKWMHYLLRFEKKDLETRDKHIEASRAKLKKRTEQDSSEQPKGKPPKKKRGFKRTSQGVARFCSMYKKAGMSEVKYTSHTSADYTNKGQYETKFSGGLGKREEAKKIYKKEFKKVSSKYRKQARQLKAFKKALGKNNPKELRKLKRTQSNSSSSSSSSSSDSDSDRSSSDSSA